MNDNPKIDSKASVVELVSQEAPSVRRQLEDALRKAILSGAFAPGERLRERRLLEMFSVSRTSLREALRQIEAQGLVTLEPNRGPAVAMLTEDDVEEINEARAVLEGQASAGFAERASDAQVAEVQRLFRAMCEAASAQEPERILNLKSDLYTVILDGCGNRIVQQMLSLLHNRILLMRRTFIASLSEPERLREPIGELRELVDAIVARDSKAARAASEHHVREAARVTLRAMRRNAASPLGRSRSRETKDRKHG
jgi:DNA-binding GntR family transcriptional regulator